MWLLGLFLFIPFFIVAGIVACVFLIINDCNKKYEKRCESLYHCREMYCPPLLKPEKEDEEEIPVEIIKPKEPVKPKEITVQEWVKKNIDYLVSFLDDESKERFFIPNNRLEGVSKENVEQWLLEQFRVEHTQIKADGINIKLCNPSL